MKGADIVLGGRTEAKLERVASEVEALGRRALPVMCDIADADSCRALTDRAAAELGGVHILVNNAFDGGNAKSFMDSDFDDWRHTMDVNLFGTLGMTRAAVPAPRGERRRPGDHDQLDVGPAHPTEVGRLRRVEGGAAPR